MTWCASAAEVRAALTRGGDHAALIDTPGLSEKRPLVKYEALRWLLEDPALHDVIVTTHRAVTALDERVRVQLRRLRISLASEGGGSGLALYAYGLPTGSPAETEQVRLVLERIRALDARGSDLPARVINRLGSPDLPDLLNAILMGPAGLGAMPRLGRVTVREFDEWMVGVGLLDGQFTSWSALRSFLIRNLYDEPLNGANGEPVPALAACLPQGDGAVRPPTLAELVGRLPPPLRLLPAADLPVSTARARSALVALGRKPVEHLAELGEAKLLCKPNLGRRSLEDIREALHRLVAERPTTIAVALATGQGQILDHLRASVARLPERSREIANRRTFASGSARETLEDLAIRLGVTRERVRQLEQAILHGLGSEGGVAGLLDQRLSAASRVRAAPLTAENLEARDPFFAGVAESPELLGGLLAALECRYRLVPALDGAPAFFSDASAKLEPWVSELRDKLRGVPANELERRVREFAVQRGCPELTVALLGRLEPVLDGPEGLMFNPRKVDVIEAVFLHADGPLHVEEVDRRLRQVGHVLPKAAVRGAVTRMDVVNVGPSAYVHASKLVPWRRYEDEVVPLVEGIMTEDKDRSWSSRDLIGALSDAGARAAETIPWFALDYLLSQHPKKFQRTGRGLWSLASHAPVRVNAHEMAVSVVRKRGPMPLSALEAAIRRVRSLGGPLSLRPPLCRLPDGRIGHLDRDLPWAHGTQVETFLAAVETELRAGGGVLARRQVIELFRRTVPDGSEIGPQTVMLLAAHRAGLRLSRSLLSLGATDVAHTVLDSLEDSQDTNPPAPCAQPNREVAVPREARIEDGLRALLHSRDDWNVDELADALYKSTGIRCTRVQLRMRMEILDARGGAADSVLDSVDSEA